MPCVLHMGPWMANALECGHIRIMATGYYAMAVLFSNLLPFFYRCKNEEIAADLVQTYQADLFQDNQSVYVTALQGSGS
jgi:hypothetical protein